MKTGGKTPLAGMIHALTVLVIVLAFAPLVSKIPLAALSAILMMIAWNMSEVHHFRHLFKAPRSDVMILLTTFVTTVLVDLTVAVAVGMIVAFFFFVKKIGMLTEIVPLGAVDQELKDELESFDREKIVSGGMEIYEITGPLFFGVADSLKHILSNMEFPPKVFILRMRKVPAIDATGMHALREFHYTCQKEGTQLLLSEVNDSLHHCLMKFGLIDLIGENHIFPQFISAIQYASKEKVGGVIKSTING